MAEKPGSARAGKGGSGNNLTGLVLATVLAAGAGFGYASFLPGSVADAVAEPAKAALPADAHGATSGHGGNPPAHGKEAPAILFTGARTLAPIVTNLAAPEGTWVRLEASVYFDGVESKMAETLQNEIAGDILAYLHSLSLPQIQGALGLQHLREDLNERIGIRSRGKARDMILSALVVQ